MFGARKKLKELEDSMVEMTNPYKDLRDNTIPNHYGKAGTKSDWLQFCIEHDVPFVEGNIMLNFSFQNTTQIHFGVQNPLMDLQLISKCESFQYLRQIFNSHDHFIDFRGALK